MNDPIETHSKSLYRNLSRRFAEQLNSFDNLYRSIEFERELLLRQWLLALLHLRIVELRTPELPCFRAPELLEASRDFERLLP